MSEATYQGAAKVRQAVREAIEAADRAREKCERAAKRARDARANLYRAQVAEMYARTEK